MERYCIGFFFSDDFTKVLLVRKTHGPNDQAGKLNGIGGVAQPHETLSEAMERTFRKETGLYCDAMRWNRFGTLTGGSGASAYVIGLFYAAGHETWDAMEIDRHLQGEVVELKDVSTLNGSQQYAPGTCWMAMMALGRLHGSDTSFYDCSRPARI